MLFSFSTVEETPILSKAANDGLKGLCVWANPNENLKTELSELATLKIIPFMHEGKLARYVLEPILELDIRSDDVFVCSLAKCGSSWLQNIVWLLKNDLDYKTIESVKRSKLIADFEDRLAFDVGAGELMAKDSSKSLTEGVALGMAFTMIHDKMKSSRCIKTHLPVYALPKNIWSNEAKVIYICRNIKDMIVSEYHFWRNFLMTDITIDDVVNGVTNNKWLYSSHIDHVLNYWNVKHLPNVLFITYEDLISDSFATIKKVSEFVECSYTDERLKKLTEFTSFDNMKKNKSLSREDDVVKMENHFGKKRPDPAFTFLRNGKSGSYRDALNEDQIKRIDEWIGKSLKDTDFRFKE